MHMSHSIRILVVDDEIPVCNSIASALGETGYEIDTALSGEEAIKKNDTHPYDLIITDLMMPGISGMDLLKALMERDTNTRVIMITGYPSAQSAVEAVKLGAVDYLPKPFTPEQLRAMVVRIVETLG
jgi:DNA-binding NtrC family response regulator